MLRNLSIDATDVVNFMSQMPPQDLVHCVFPLFGNSPMKKSCQPGAI